MSQNEYSTEPHWYVVHTYSGYENKVKKDLEKMIENRDLQNYIFKVVVPMEEHIEIKKGETKNMVHSKKYNRSNRICRCRNKTNTTFKRRS